MTGKIEEAENAGVKGLALKCTAYVVEGDSAVGNVLESMSHMTKAERAFIGIFPFRGKILNVMNADLSQLIANEELNNFKHFMGLSEGIKGVEEIRKHLKYGNIMMKFDADEDGKHIMGLFILWLHCRFPDFLRHGGLFLERSPILRVDAGGQKFGFYSRSEYAKWLVANPGMQKYKPKYIKGLGTSSDEDIKDEVRNRRIVTMIYDDKAPETLKVCFDEKLADMRKQLISNWKERYEVEAINMLPISFFLNEEFMHYWKKSIERAIPHAFDGFKRSQRQIIHTTLKLWNVLDKKFATTKDMKQMKVETLANSVSMNLKYEHGATSLEQAIFQIIQDFVGSNNRPLLQAKGQVGSRRKGGKDVPAARYPYTCPQQWLHYVFNKLDMELIPDRDDFEEESDDFGDDAKDKAHTSASLLKKEKKFFLPIIPLHLVNGVNGVACAWMSYIPNFHPQEIIHWYRVRNQQCIADEKTITNLRLVTPRPYWQGFTGTIEIKKTAVHTKSEPMPELKGEIVSHDVHGEPGEVSAIPEFKVNVEGKMVTPVVTSISAPVNYKLSIVTKGVLQVQGDKCIITELPVGRWTVPYKKHLLALKEEKKLKKVVCDPSKKKVRFEITGLQIPATLESLLLTKCYSLSNMVMLLPDGSVHKFATVEEMLEYFFNQRHFFYEQRRKLIIQKQEYKINDLRQLIKFQELVKERKIIIDDGVKNELHTVMDSYALPHKFLERNLYSITRTDTQEQRKKLAELENKLAEFRKQTASHLWLEDLEALSKCWIKQYGKE